MLSALFSNAIHDNQCDAGQGQQQPRLPTTPTNFYLSIQFGLRFGIKKLAFSPSLNPHPLGDSVSIQQNCSMKRDEGNAVVAHFGATANHRGDTRLVALWTTFSGIDIVSKLLRLFAARQKHEVGVGILQKKIEKNISLSPERSARQCWKTWWCHHHHLLRTPLCRCHCPLE